MKDEKEIKNISIFARKLIENISRVMVGQEETIRLVVTAMLSGGHLLIEDRPGTGKTTMAKTMANSMEMTFKRVQFTPDLMPSDITGLNIYNRKTSEFQLVKGPVFTNILLADEINRGTPRTQSSLLECMEEHQVTIDGVSYILEEPFFVIATENRMETTGTFPLPEAQLDRFAMKISMTESNKAVLLGIIDRFIEDNPADNIKSCISKQEFLKMRKLIRQVFVHTCVREYMADIALATNSASRLAVGASNRSILSLLRISQAYAAVSGRDYVSPDDVKYLAPFVLSHRVTGAGGYRDTDRMKTALEEIIAKVEVPVENWEK